MNTEKKERLLLLSADARLEHLLAAEACSLDIPLRTERTVPTADMLMHRELALILWDVDSIPLPATLPLTPRCPIYGIATQAPDDSPLLTDCFCHPISVDHLRAALLRQIYAGPTAVLPEEERTTALLMSEDGSSLQINGVTVALTDKESIILSLLLQHRGSVVTKEELYRAITETESGDGTKDAVSNKVEVYLCHLRRKIEQPFGLRLFTTVRGQGYRLADEH